MKKVLLTILLGITICLCGCANEVKYITKYVSDCETTPLREEPSNDAKVLEDLQCGEAVSFEKDAQNGYSKVVYNGVTGYVLSSHISAKKPRANKANNGTQQPSKSADYSYQNVMADYDSAHIENYIASYVRPLYSRINNNLNSYTKTTSAEATLWYSGNVCVKKEFAQGSANISMARQYYYDTVSGDLVFAFVFSGSEEHRFYFEDNKLVRYIDVAGIVVDNPTSSDVLKTAVEIINDAY